MPRQRQKSVQSLDPVVPPELADGPRSVPPMPGANPTPSPLTAGHMTPNPPPPSTDLGELIGPEVATSVGPGHPMFDNGPHNSMMNFNRPQMGSAGPMGPNNMGPGFNNMGPGFNHMGPGPPPNTMGPNQMGTGPPNSIGINNMGPMPPNSMGQGPNNMAMMNMGGFGPGGPGGHPGPGKVYPPNQPMVFNASNPNAPPIYPCGYCHKEVHDNDQAILCESGCNFWFHRPCTGLTEPAYLMLTKEVYAEWSCDKCLQSKSIPLVKLKP